MGTYTETGKTYKTEYPAKKPEGIRDYLQYSWYLLATYSPPPVLWRAFTYALNRTIGQPIMLMIYPLGHAKWANSWSKTFPSVFEGIPLLKEINRSEKYRENTIERLLSKYQTLQTERYTVTTYDDVELDTIKISPSDTAANKHIYLINFGSNAECYEGKLATLHKFANLLQCNVIGFNHRGVLGSKGDTYSPEDSIVDGIAQVQHLLDQGVNAKDIRLYGRSYGAAVATKVAAFYEERGIKLKLFSDRSFWSLSWAGTGMVFGNKYFYPIVKFLMTITRTDLVAGSEYSSLDDDQKTYLTAKNDDLIIDFASTHAGLGKGAAPENFMVLGSHNDRIHYTRNADGKSGLEILTKWATGEEYSDAEARSQSLMN